MDDQIKTIRQLQLTIQLASNENKELREKWLFLRSQYDPELDSKINNLEKTILIQQQQISQLQQQKLNSSNIKDFDDEDEQYQMQQLNLKLNEQNQQLIRYQENVFQIQSQLRNCEEEMSDLQQTLNQHQVDNAIFQKKAQQMEQLLSKVRGQEPLSLQYINEIDRLTTKLQQLQKNCYIKSRLTHQS
ncbi:unnamed protein product (macronuclear) [Paramecium tetraurelia]|uniref:Uncharacterized protein n=1 Tax=Paramecium tetraurelia TaxID=5888 RepID=A0EAM1_PARTE|nr:uncharacterized protein GSPATT00025072001 [Paramecium tetraurelia]CAK92338.1 unnamed protein product [Paramecium tetraurelia]|eukprot:XP_001459735.1 hypothetical protein (macronuclear) [Paramecium tetraurelia strain d4-2]